MKASLLVFVALAASAADFDLAKTKSGIEQRYNTIRTLEAKFTQTTIQRGHPKTVETGTLYVEKPGKTRWEYSSPAGKLWISDNKFTYSYDPGEKRAEKESMKGTDDVRAPLAFILGKIQFDKDFGRFETTVRVDGSVMVTAFPKSDKFPYTQVSFVPGPDYSLHEVSVKLVDSTVMTYVFQDEKRNVAIATSMFQFTPPPGTEIVDNSR